MCFSCGISTNGSSLVSGVLCKACKKQLTSIFESYERDGMIQGVVTLPDDTYWNVHPIDEDKRLY